MPKVSVLMPIYNTKEEFLREAIESVLNQTFQDYEFIILNNSPANTDLDQVVGSYKDNRIRYVKSEKDTGISEGRNKLIKLAQGEYLAVLDHDDICLPTRLEEEVKVLDEHPEIGVVGTLYERFPKSKGASKLAEFSDAIEQYLMESCAVLHPSSMIRASVLKEHNIRYEEEFTPAEDYALWCRLIGKTKFYNIQKVLMKYRWHGNNTSILQDDKRLKAVEKIHDFVKRDHLKLWNAVHNKATHIVRAKLFGIIPILRKKMKGDALPKWLKYLPFIKVKIKMYVPQRNISSINQFKKEIYTALLYAGKASILWIDHALGGGTETYSLNQFHELSDRYNILRLQYHPGIESFRLSMSGEILGDFKEFDSIKSLIAEYNFTEICVNNIVGWYNALNLLDFITSYKKKHPKTRVTFRGHDFHCLCPSFNLLNCDYTFCNLTYKDGCQTCIKNVKLDDNEKNNRILFSGFKNIDEWRKTWGDFFANTLDEAIVFSNSTKELFVKLYPILAQKTQIIPHRTQQLPQVIVDKHEDINVAMLGNMTSVAKGKHIIETMCQINRDPQLHLFVIGDYNSSRTGVIVTGRYRTEELPNLIKDYKIDLILIPSIWPETFSYTTSEAMAMNIAVACYNMGAPAERVLKYEKGLVLDKIDPKSNLILIKKFVQTLRKEQK